MRFSQIRRLFWEVGVGGGVGVREKKHELCQIVLKKQTSTSTRCYYSVQLRSLIYTEHCSVGPTNFIGTITTTIRMKISTDEDFYG